ncbi:calcitonin gene-related peptide type 1 receptor-like [Amphibalanus amphitrite]|uniref:calcitonin gene-related peptide type 1 receptor-like n=1 Tax=Amphibalanus amphitrite TaxID=1232801 RepID=UPI001C8FBE2E|nr:calcitonin gene-related peptide type 1 receptor-like [Amphibalanus amphitrite]
MFDVLSSYLYSLDGNVTVLANVSDAAATATISATFAEPQYAAKWLGCCQSSHACCRSVLRRPESEIHRSGEYCPATEDGWLCWNTTRAGQTVYQQCPDYIYSHQRPSCRVFAKKQCTSNGTWWAPSAQHGEFTDYGECSNMWRGLVRQYVNIGCNGVSVLVLLPAVLLSAAIRSLHQGPLLLHGSLMAALLIRCIMVIATSVVLNIAQLTGAASDADGGLGCRLLQAFYKYAVLSSWTWMLAVGLGLHNSIARPFAKQFSAWVFCTLGWGVPVLFVAGWAAAKVVLENELCWMLNVHNLVWILDAPKLACFLINLGFMINVLRILNTKLESSEARRRSFRAAAMLVPLFGLQFLVTALPPPDDVDCDAEQAYYVVSYLISGLQGAVVACIYFYTNAEVRSQLVLQWRRFQARRGSGSRAPPRRRTLSTEVPASGPVQRRQLASDAERAAAAAAAAAADPQQMTVTSLLGADGRAGGGDDQPDLVQDTAT